MVFKGFDTMPPDIIKIVCDGFNLGKVVQVYTGTKGVTNKKYRITTDIGEFFIKVFKNMPDSALEYIHDVEVFMLSKGIPAVISLSVDGRLWLVNDGITYVVYPFIKTNFTKNHSLEEYEQMGALLGKIHWASQQNTPQKLFSNLLTHKKKEEGIENLKKVKQSILKRTFIDKNDKIIIDSIEYKLSLSSNAEEGSLFVRDALVHGDFHPDNLLFDQEAGKIVGVCDWEKARYGSRVSELAHALVFSCFHKDFIYESAVTNAQAILRGYRREYSVSKQEIGLGFLAHLHFCIMNTSNETLYYTQQKPDIIEIIDHERHIIDLISSKKIISDILGA